MAKKPTEIEETKEENEQEKEIERIEFDINTEDSFYMVEYPEVFGHFTIFNTLEGAVEVIEENKEGYKSNEFRILSISKGSKGLEIAQIPWTDIIDILMRDKNDS